MTNLDSILNSREIILLTNIHVVKPIVSLAVKYECESWSTKNIEDKVIDDFE